MTGFARTRFYFVIAATVWTCPQALDAATITYSWSGTVRLYDDSTPNPWGIGAGGVPFAMSTTVAATAVDLNPTQIPPAVFRAISSRLWVDGEEIPFVGDALIDFSDYVDSPDAVTMGGAFAKNGVQVTIDSVVALSPLTFSFSATSERPPFFSSTLTTSQGMDVARPYVTTVAAGSAVTVVPEPTASALAVIGVLGLNKRRR